MNKKLSKLKKSLSVLKIARFLVQIIFLYFFSGLFTLAFTGFKSIYLGLARENFSIANSFTFLAAFAGVVALSVLMGRFFCGWICSFGTFNDLLYLVSSKIFKKKIKIPTSVDEKLKYIKYIVLLGIIIFMWSMNKVPEKSINPWDAFAQLFQVRTMGKEMPIAFIFLGIIIIGAVFIERFFCRYLCPLGAIQAILSKFKIINISKPTEKCGKCQLCTGNCPMGINLSQVEAVDSGECIGCLKCVDTCYRSNPKVVVLKKLNMQWYSSSAAAILIFSFIFFGSKFVKPEAKIGSVNAAQLSKVDEAIFSDGVYTGVGQGYRPNLKVQVKISKGLISDIKIVSHEETKGYYEQAFEVVPKEIIAAQSTNVDVVSGATRSSNGIRQAVADALNKARKDKSKNQAVDNSKAENTQPQTETVSTDVSMDKNAKFKDGTYTGIAKGYAPGLTVSVTIKDGKISDIRIISHNETPGFYEKAFSTVPKEIIAAQSTDVDAVSGATFSSRGIMAAVKNALEKALISGELPDGTAAVETTSSRSGSNVDVSSVISQLPVYTGTGKYKDGVYTGTGKGYQPGLKVSVTIKDGKITDIRIISHNETSGFYEKPFAIVPKEIISKQDTNVDVVSGATRSSEGIIAAVNDALKNARLDGSTPQPVNTLPSSESPVNPAPVTPQVPSVPSLPAESKYKDGVYTGMANGFQPGLTVLVTVKDGKISDIKITAHNESKGFYEKPFDLIPKEIIEKQGTNVDAVSGATYTSRGIMNAVANALKNAVVGGTDENPTTPTNPTEPTTPTTPAAPVEVSAQLYKDGTYTGIGTGLKNNLIIDVTVKDNKITDLNLITYKEGIEYMKKAMTPMSERIIAAQSTKVDVVSGATETSNGIKDAVNKALESAKYKDGAYTGQGRGYNRTDLINVKVTVKDGKMNKIDIVSQAETPAYFEKTWPSISNKILETQSTKVDAVSGATRSSSGIMSAVKAALASDTSVGQVSTYPSKQDVIAPFRDGIYTGKGKGHAEDLTVNVTIKNNKIIKIDLGSNDETPEYFQKVWTLLPNEMIEKQSADVDAVSGATRSTNGLICAVKDALRNSKLALTAPALAPYKDGTYEGEANGFRGLVKVNVEVKGNKILKVDMISNVDDKDWFEKAWSAIPEKIVEANNANVDVVSGATYSSKGIIGAVNDALRKAHDLTLNLDGVKEASETTPKMYKDGKYTGVAKGFKNDLTLDVTVKDNKIADINLIYYKDDVDYIKRAVEPMSQKIISAQSTDVDVVSGATMTSNGIKEAVNNALAKAVYKDGVFTGTGYGYNQKDPIKLDITVKDGKLKDVDIVSENDTASYFWKSWPSVPNKIIETQSTDLEHLMQYVDTYSGATKSAYGVFVAIKDALSQDTTAGEISTYPSKEDLEGPFTDGDYTGTAKGYQDNLNVTVTVKDGKISRIRVGTNAETPEYFVKAYPVVTDAMVKDQSTNVDIVSGATRSSIGLINAVKDALSKSKGGAAADPAAPYKDGSYEGEAKGLRDGLKVKVTFKNDKITNIESVINNEDAQYFNKAWKRVTDKIIANQTSKVDAVSGATYSSNGIMSAVKNAMSKAHDGASGSASDSGSEVKQPVISTGYMYKDGRYTGIGKGLKNNLTVDVTVKDNRITNINLITYKEGIEYMKKAMTPMSERIIAAQSTNVDVVSGATETSNGIKEAVNKALENAKYKDGTYTGEGRGYNRTNRINLSVTVKDSKINSIDLISQAETEEYFNKTWPVVPNAIINSQSLKVDTVSGATRSSNGIISAVKAALTTDSSMGTESTYPSVEDVSAPFRDGIYTGKGKGHAESLTVNVTIKENKIIKIDLGPNDETPEYFKKVWPLLPNEMIQKQSADVDAVSGATRSTNGLICAVKDALRNSKLALKAEPKGPYKDGTYSGVADGYGKDLNVQVTVKNNKITRIRLGSNNETPSYFVKAWGPVSSAIIEKQSPNVDVISGATYSSKGIMEAVKAALRKAHDATLDLQPAETNNTENSGGTNSSNSSSGSNSSSNNAENNSSNNTSSGENNTNTGGSSGSSNSSGNSSGTGSGNNTNSNGSSTSSGGGTSQNSNTSGGNSTNSSENNSNTSSNSTKAAYKDGIYTGTADGFQPGLKLSITIKEGKITEIKTIASNETESFYDSAFENVSKAIISKQSTEVDSVSGATFSSKGIMNAVKAALDTGKS